MIVEIGTMLLGTGLGWKAHAHLTANYKERWQLAVKLLEEDPDKSKQLELERKNEELSVTIDQLQGKRAVEIRGGSKAQKELKEIDLLMGLTPAQRAKLEKERLWNGLPPIDPLTNLPGDVIVKMKKERMWSGYDG